MVFPSCNGHGHKNCSDASCQLAQDDRHQHLRVKSGGEAQVIAEDEGGRDGEGHVDHLAPLVHVLYHTKHGDGIRQAGNEPGCRSVVHAQQATQLH